MAGNKPTKLQNLFESHRMAVRRPKEHISREDAEEMRRLEAV